MVKWAGSSPEKLRPYPFWYLSRCMSNSLPLYLCCSFLMEMDLIEMDAFTELISCSVVTRSMETVMGNVIDDGGPQVTDDMLELKELDFDYNVVANVDLEKVDFGFLDDSSVEIDLAGFRSIPHPTLLDAGKGKEKSASEHNDRWAMRRADQLRSSLGWDMSVPLGDLPLSKLDELFSNLFARVVKVKGGEDYPAATLMNMMGGFNRIIRRASEVRSLTTKRDLVKRDFNIKVHPQFTKTRLVLKAAVKKSGRDGTNKKRNKVEILTTKMEAAILSDIDHQISTNTGCQKRLAFFFLVRLGIRGGKELYELQRQDIRVDVDCKGREFVRFEERESKNNSYSLDRYSEEQFRKVYHNYEDDFILCVKQYLRHMPPPEDSKPDLFLGCITSPATNMWYNRCHKVSKERASAWLKGMLTLVGLSVDFFSNRSGRATLVTRLAARGVPDEVGMLITGHHTTDGYLRYDRTQNLKMEAAALVSAEPNLCYKKALTDVYKKFIEESVVGSSSILKPLVKGSPPMPIQPAADMICHPLVERVTGKSISMTKNDQAPSANDMLKVADKQSLSAWHKHYDEINWDEELAKNPQLAKAMGGGSQISIGSSMVGNTFNQCTINIICHKQEDKENQASN